MSIELKIYKLTNFKEIAKSETQLNVIDIRNKSLDFNKTWYDYIMYALGITGTKAKQFVFWLFEQAENGRILMTFAQMASNSKISLFTVTNVMNKLVGAGIIKKINVGAYQLVTGINEDLSSESSFNILFIFHK